MEQRRQRHIGTAACSVMHFLGSATRSLCEGFYFIAPFMRPEEPGKVDYVLREKSLAGASAGSSSLETAAAPGHKDLFSRQPAGETVKKLEVAEKPEEETVDAGTFFGDIDFESKLEKVKAEIFIKDFHSPLRKVRTRALGQLRSLSKPAAVGILKELLSLEKDSLQIIEILNTLSGLNDDGKLQKQIFTDFLRHPNPRLRQAAIRALSKCRDEESFSILSSCLNDDDARVRRLVLNCLSWTFPDRCAAAVLRLLHDVDNHVRKSAILICGAFKLRQSISALITLLSDPDKDIQANAVTSLRKITGQNFGFKATGSEKNKNAAVEDWRFWWLQNQTKFVM